jgi:hypothetical protein
VIPKFKDKFGYGGFIELHDCPGCTDRDMVDDSGKFFRRVGANTFDAHVRIDECDQNGVLLYLNGLRRSLILAFSGAGFNALSVGERRPLGFDRPRGILV